MSNQILIINGLDEQEERIQLVRLEGYEVNLRVDDNSPQFPYRLGDTTFIKVYDPQERKDCDSEIRAWRFGFVVTKTQIMGSGIYVYGFSYGRMNAIDLHLCYEEEDHLPWEHDGACGYDQEYTCGYDQEYTYQGPVALELYQWGEEKPLAYQFHEILGGIIDKTEVKV